MAFTTTTGGYSVLKSRAGRAAVPSPVTVLYYMFVRRAARQSYASSPEPPERWTQSGVAQVATGE
jgi:hypothetical protein